MRKLILCIISCMGLVSGTVAAPAYPFPVKVQQPDGTEITVRMRGDEYFHYIETADGYITLQNTHGYYTYAVINDQNQLIPGEVRVSEGLKNLPADAIRSDSPLFKEKIMAPAFNTVIEERLKESETVGLRSSSALPGENSKGLIILANFKDVKFSVNDAQQTFTDILNLPNYSDYGMTGSVRDYYLDNSVGAFVPEFDVFGPVELPEDMAFYGEDGGNNYRDKNPKQMVVDACNALKAARPDINFADYDVNNDGAVDYVFILYAGYNQGDQPQGVIIDPNTIWPHQSSIKEENLTIDGVQVVRYACTSELRNGTQEPMGIGLFIHEYSHILGLPEFYDADGGINGRIADVGYWSIMSYGTYLNNGKTPPYYGTMERKMLGWISPQILTVTDKPQTITLPAFASTNTGYILPTATENEYFIFEARTPRNTGVERNWDGAYPGEGLFVYHIDSTTTANLDIIYGGNPYRVSPAELWKAKIPNIIGDHQCMDLLRANYDYYVPAGNPYPFEEINSLSDKTFPSLVAWDGTASGIEITDITFNENDGSVTFTIVLTDDSGIEENQADQPKAYISGQYLYFQNIKYRTRVEIVDIQGRLVDSDFISGDDVRPFPYSGQFIIKLSEGEKHYTYKVSAN